MKKVSILYLAFCFIGTIHPIKAQINLDIFGNGILRSNVPTITFFDVADDREEGSLGENANDIQLKSLRGNLEFFTGTAGTATQRFTILGSNGNVGIGTTSPARLLDVDGLSWFRDDLTIDEGNLVLQSSNNQTFRLRTETSGDLSFVGDGDVTHMELTDALGYLGLGTTSPSVKFHVVGGGDAEPSGGGYAQFGATNSTNLALDNNEIMARNNGVAADLFIQNDGGNLMLCSNEAGSVGIGIVSSTSIPSGYLLAVDGKIIGEEVRVELSGSWPDYVFKKDYNLMTISELEKSINTNGHLPGMPAAKEIEEGGILLGDMQRRLVEKIEELSLYIIQQQREIEALKTGLSSLKNK